MRDKLFLNWLDKTNKAKHQKEFEMQLSLRYLNRLLLKTFKKLRKYQMKKKRELIVSAIIKERQATLLISSVLSCWKDRFESKMQKKTLYWHIKNDFNLKLKYRIMECLVHNAQEKKEARIKGLIEKKVLEETSD